MIEGGHINRSLLALGNCINALSKSSLYYEWYQLKVAWCAYAGVSLEAGYQWSTTTYVASHHWLLNLTFKRVVVVISSTETGRNNYESLYFVL